MNSPRPSRIALAERSSSLRPIKLAEQIADEISRHIRSKGLTRRALLGNRTDLSREYGVSPAIMREAMRLLEDQGIAVARKGRGGGLVVVASTGDAPVDALLSYMEFLEATPEELHEVREEIAVVIQGAAATCPDEREFETLMWLYDRASQQLDSLLNFAERFLDVSAQLARMSRNPGLSLFHLTLERYLSETIPIDQADAGATTLGIELGLANLQKTLAEVLSGNRSNAEAVARTIFRNSRLTTLGQNAARPDERRLQRGFDRSALAADLAVSKGSMAATLMRVILREIRARGWPIGEKLGTEADYLARYGISRDVFRAAVRLLERHGAAEMRSGNGGGLIVCRPDPAVTIRAAVDFLTFSEFTAKQALDARGALEPIAIRRLANTITAETAVRLGNALSRTDRCRAVYDILGSSLQMPLTSLFLQILWHSSVPLAHHRDEDASLTQMVEAIIARDPTKAERLARRRLCSDQAH